MNLLIRAASAIVLLPLVLAAIHFGGIGFFALIAIATAIAIYEGLGLALPESAQRRRQAVIFSFTMGGIAMTMLSPGAPVGLALALLMCGLVLSGVMIVLRPGDIEVAARRWVSAVFVSIYAGLPFLLLLGLRDLGEGDQGPRFIYLLMAATWCNDTMAYFAGRTFGKHPMHPVVSPKKTWEGFAGGAAGSLGAALVCRATFLPELGLVEALVYGAVMAPLVPLGDLAESLLKRAAGVKDSGNIIPGHGGLLDRVDALLFALPWTYIVATFALSR